MIRLRLSPLISNPESRETCFMSSGFLREAAQLPGKRTPPKDAVRRLSLGSDRWWERIRIMEQKSLTAASAVIHPQRAPDEC